MTYAQRISLVNFLTGLHLLSTVGDTPVTNIFGWIGAVVTIFGWIGLILPTSKDKD